MIGILLLFLAAIFLSAFFSGMETGFYRAARVRLVLDGMSGDKVASSLLWMTNKSSIRSIDFLEDVQSRFSPRDNLIAFVLEISCVELRGLSFVCECVWKSRNGVDECFWSMVDDKRFLFGFRPCFHLISGHLRRKSDRKARCQKLYFLYHSIKLLV